MLQTGHLLEGHLIKSSSWAILKTVSIFLPCASLSAHHKKVEPCLYIFQASVPGYLNDKLQQPWFGGTQLWPPTSIKHVNVALTWFADCSQNSILHTILSRKKDSSWDQGFNKSQVHVWAEQVLSETLEEADGGQVSFSGCLTSRLLNATNESLLPVLVVWHVKTKPISPNLRQNITTC